MSLKKLKIFGGTGALFFAKFLPCLRARCYKYQVKNLKQIWNFF